MKGIIRFLEIDRAIQTIIIVITLVGFLLIFPGLAMLFVLGCWQLLSGLILWIALRRKIFRDYFINSILYLFVMYMAFGSMWSTTLFVVFIIGAIGIGLWYHILVNKTLDEFKENEDNYFFYGDMENILDSDEILSSKI